MDTTRRLPHFVLIGAAKSGTTALFRWLTAHPGVFDTPVKEPRFFSQRWDDGLDWYCEHFAAAAPDELIGEASTNYTDPRYDDVVAPRMVEVLPEARLVYLVRHPIERLRSQYRYHLRRAVVTEPLAQAVREPANLYLGRSLYYTRLLPFIERFPREQLLVTRFEDLVGDDGTAWGRILRHLGLAALPRPDTAHNVTDDQKQVSRPVAWLRDHGVLERTHLVPRGVRRAARSALSRSARSDGSVSLDVPEDVELQIWEDVAQLERWLGVTEPLWTREPASARRP